MGIVSYSQSKVMADKGGGKGAFFSLFLGGGVLCENIVRMAETHMTFLL